MTVSLSPIAANQFDGWKARSQREYAADLVASGQARGAAERQAESTLQQAFPGNAPTADNAVFDLVHETDGVVGYLWIGRDHSGDPACWWVWDVVVDTSYRGKGYGREAMQLAETQARSMGATSLGLSVFGSNTAARKLYESLGYETTTVKMRKPL